MWKKVKYYSSNINLKFITLCFLILVILTSNCIILFETKTNTTNEITMKDFINNEVQNNYIEELRKKYNNQDIIGTISINNTNLKEIVLQSKDNSYYLNHNIYKEYDKYGSIFMDYRINLNNTKKILIFGHNSSYIDTPFKELENYYNEEYFKEHKYITLQTENNKIIFEIFSVYIETQNWDYMNLNFKSKKKWNDHLLRLKNNSLYDTKVNINSTDEIIILQTCSYHKSYSNYNKKYLLIIGKKITK